MMKRNTVTVLASGQREMISKGENRTMKIKRIAVLMTALLLMLQIFPAMADSAIKGDINLDGRLTDADLTLLKEYLVGNQGLYGQSLRNADINGDGKITSTDTLQLKQLLNNNSGGSSAPSSSQYLVPDSSTRRMTESECWNWSYDALGYVYHEILARHGFIFDPNGEYGWYFTAQYWYHSIASRNNQDVYNQLNSTEWYNIDLIKAVREKMRQTGNYNYGGRPAPTRTTYNNYTPSEPSFGNGSWF